MTAALDAAAQARQRGAWGERHAALWLIARGWTVLAADWRCADGQLDLVVARAGTIAAVEVKTRRGDRYGPPEAAVTAAKVRRLRRLLGVWCATERPGATRLAIDVVAITLGPDDRPLAVRHLQDVSDG